MHIAHGEQIAHVVDAIVPLDHGQELQLNELDQVVDLVLCECDCSPQHSTTSPTAYRTW